MKRPIVTIALLAISVCMVSAQENPSWKRLENNIMLGGGLFLESGSQSYGNNPGAVLRLSYGLDVRLNEKWSVMPGAGLRAQLGDIRHFMWIGGDPMDPLNNKEKFKRFDVGLQPSVTFLHGKHFQWGFEGCIGLLNAMRQYPEYNRRGSIHLHYLAVTCGWHF